MAETIETLVIRIGADVVDLKSAIADGTKTIDSLAKSTRATATAMQQALTQATSNVSSRLSSISNTVKSFAATTVNLKTAFEGLGTPVSAAISRISGLSGPVSTVTKSLGSLGAVALGTVRQIAAISTPVVAAGSQLGSLSTLSASVTAAFASLGRTATTVATSLARFVTEALQAKVAVIDLRRVMQGIISPFSGVVGQLQKMKSPLDSSTKGLLKIGAAFLTVQTAISAFTNAIDIVRQLNALSQSTGISIEKLSELKFAAEQSGIEFESLRQVISQFGGRMTEALSNPTSRGALALQALGVSVKDAQGNLQTFADILPSLADQFAKYADGANKSALASALFGEEAGPKLIPLLNQGSAGIAALQAKAKELGVTLDQDSVQKIEDFRKSSLNLRAALQDLTIELVGLLAPGLTKAIGLVTSFIRELRNAYQTISENKRIHDLADAFQEFNTAAAAVKDLTIRTEELMKKLEEVAATGGPGAELAFRALEASINANQDALGPWIERMNTAKQKIEELKAAAASGATPVTVDTPNKKPDAPSIAGVSDQLKEAQFQLQEFLTVAEGGGTIAESFGMAWTSTADRIAEAQKKVDAAYKDSAEAQRQMTGIKRSLLKSEEQAYMQVAQTAAQALTALFPKSKAAAIAAAIINTAVGITEAMKLPFPLNIAQAALVAAMGAAQIATIKSTNQNGGGRTPTTSVGSGGGGTPEPSTGTANPGRSLFIQGIDPAQYFSGRQLENLITAINGEVKNGVTLISTKNLPI